MIPPRLSLAGRQFLLVSIRCSAICLREIRTIGGIEIGVCATGDVKLRVILGTLLDDDSTRKPSPGA
jgi:hypothetical protein